MRIRSIKPEFWRSSDISVLSIEDRLLFIGLWSYVDDNGVGVDKLAAIVADLFADDVEKDAPETFARVSRGLQNLSEGGRIVRYTVDGRDFLSIANWGKHQRIDKPGKPRFPRHDADLAEIRESVASVPEKVAPGTGEQGNRGTGEQGENTMSDSGESDDIRADVQEVIDHMVAALEANDVRKSKVGKSWHTSARLLIDKDGYTVEQIKWITTWATTHHFWKSNILSMPKLREKFDQLKLQATTERPASNIDQRRAENVQRISQRQPWSPDQQDPSQWGAEEVRALGR